MDKEKSLKILSIINDVTNKVKSDIDNSYNTQENLNDEINSIKDLYSSIEKVEEQPSANINIDNIALYFKTVEDMKGNEKLVPGNIVKTLGYYEVNDGGAGEYIIYEDENAIEDGGAVIKLNNGYIAKLAFSNNTVNIKQFGAKGDDNSDDTKIINYVFNYIGELGGGVIYIPKGVYKITDQIRIKHSNISVIGQAGNKIKYYGLGAGMILFLIKGDSRLAKDAIHDINIENLNFDGSNQKFKGGASEDDLTLTSPYPLYKSGITVIRPQFVYKVNISNNTLIDFYGNGIAVDRSSFINIRDNFLWDCAGSGMGNGNSGDVFGDGIGAWKCFSISAVRNIVINTRNFKTHDILAKDVYGCPAARSGLEFEYPINIDLWDNPERWTPLSQELVKNTVSGYDLLFQDNYVYGYNKGCHLEHSSNCLIDGNTFVHNCIGFLDATGGNTIVTNNEFNSDNVGYSPQGGYHQYYAGIAITHFLGIYYDNPLISNNVFYGDSKGIIIGRSKVSIVNNIFRTLNTGIYKVADWYSEITIDGNEFINTDEKNPVPYFIDLKGYNSKIINNTFISQNKVIVSSTISMDETIISNNTFKNSIIIGNYDIFENNNFYIILPETSSQISIGRGKIVKNNIFYISGGALRFNCGNVVEGNLFNYNNIKNIMPYINIGFLGFKDKISITNNIIKTDVPLKDYFLFLDGRTDINETKILRIENNFVNNYEKNFKLFKIYNKGTQYKNFNVIFKDNMPNTIDLNSTVLTPITGNYYYINDKINLYNGEYLVCTKEGFYCSNTWAPNNYYALNTFVVNSQNNIYKCMSNNIISTVEPNLTQATFTTSDNIVWQYFGSNAEFQKTK